MTQHARWASTPWTRAQLMRSPNLVKSGRISDTRCQAEAYDDDRQRSFHCDRVKGHEGRHLGMPRQQGDDWKDHLL